MAQHAMPTMTRQGASLTMPLLLRADHRQVRALFQQCGSGLDHRVGQFRPLRITT
jgi:hypothetical protein